MSTTSIFTSILIRNSLVNHFYLFLILFLELHQHHRHRHQMLDFMYCCFEDVITEENCLELLLAASSAQLPHLRRASATFVTDSLSPGNVFRVMQLCDSGYASLFEPRIMKRAHQVRGELDCFPALGLPTMSLVLLAHFLYQSCIDEMMLIPRKWLDQHPKIMFTKKIRLHLRKKRFKDELQSTEMTYS